MKTLVGTPDPPEPEQPAIPVFVFSGVNAGAWMMTTTSSGATVLTPHTFNSGNSYG
jgi:hypothetical protein